MMDGVGKGDCMDGVPGKDAYYTGYHYTKAVCETCGGINTNEPKSDYGYLKNVYWLFDCAAEFTQKLEETVTYEYTDDTYHTVTTKGGTYCAFCYGTNHTVNSTLERHSMETEVLPQPANGRFATVEKCSLCDYASYDYTAAKAVIADYYGVVDGQPHTITVSDLSEAGVRTSIRYGNSAESCTMTSAPNYTEEGQYTVYYEITYTYQNVSMTENGVANVWLRDTQASEDGKCTCGCDDPNCGCKDKNCGGNCCSDKGCGENHHFILLDRTKAGCITLGYDRYLCTECGKIEKRDYVDSLGHAWQSIVIRDATCETDGKLLERCSRCGQMKQTATPKGEHQYKTHPVAATCTNPGYTVRECSVCGDRHIEDITSVLPHNYESHVIAATCEGGGKTIHRCDGCGSSFVTDYTAPLGHSWDEGTLITNATCTGEGVMEYRCVRCGYHRIEGNEAAGHIPGNPATCTEPQLCTRCGAVLKNALGHDYKSEVTAPTCTEMGYTTNTCTRCGDSNKSDYTEPTGHKPGDWIIDKEPTTDSEGSKHKECENCGETLETAEIDKIYNSGTTDSRGEAIVGGYLVTVTDTDTKDPVANAAVTLRKDNSISIRLPNSRLLDYADQTTVTVQLVKDMLSIDIIPVPTDEAVREMQNRLLGVETNVTNWQRRQNANNNFSAVVPYDLEQQRKETREMLDDLTTRDQRMMFAVVTLVHLADSKEELDSDTETLQSIARKHLCQLTTLNWQQADGLVTALPLGLRRIDALRTLTTEALAVLMPFKAQEIWDRGGVYYGQNAISKNLIVADRRQLLNGNAFILGVSGSGKSFSAKKEMVSLALSTQDDIIVIDPESEYRPLIEGLGGQVINISATSPNHINAMDMEQGYGDGENPVVLKSEFLLSLCEQLIGAGKLSAKEKSVIDRCTAQVYRDYIRSGYHGAVPTLQDFHAELLRQPEKEAQDVALAIELFTDGSLNTFAKPTNVDTNARILCYDIRDLGKQLLPVGMLVVLDSIFNRIIRNRGLKRNTWIYIDEIYLLFQHEYSANFLFTLWKRMRKYQACGTGISQNIEDLLQSHTARTMLANSEFLIMLNQAATDREELAHLLNISDNQLSYITNVDSGRGLIKCGSAIVPFVDHFPKNKLYRLMTTKPSDLAA